MLSTGSGWEITSGNQGVEIEEMTGAIGGIVNCRTATAVSCQVSFGGFVDLNIAGGDLLEGAAS